MAILEAYTCCAGTNGATTLLVARHVHGHSSAHPLPRWLVRQSGARGRGEHEDANLRRARSD
eukprot:1433379-Pyramimonas_sp.AAC.1